MPTQTFQSGIPFDVTYAGAGADRDVGPNRPNVSGDITINGGRDDVLRHDADRRAGQSRTRDQRLGTFGNMERNSLRGPGYRRTDASIFKNVRVAGDEGAAVPRRGRQPVQQREPRQPGYRDRIARQRSAERRPHQLDRVLQRGSAAQLPVRGQVPVLRPRDGVGEADYRAEAGKWPARPVEPSQWCVMGLTSPRLE